ncbi:gluconate 2-dehydrogenase subunit 3 family protein [Lewinella sp. W8]|uniref:gluconate 2-dehydrogenase subunit 3 family protein n=1 Tax=Lewinella sp. W8 TaxID=2528208 RepID=UPI00106840FE|nr:gluconate 2-dehydrogenase subunit 3 family protein [Lewinella sp. W8]MTB53637.1 hypothetical protein [Lewinella sp. W8]
MNRREILRYTAYLTGAAISAPVASALLSGCKADTAMAAEAYTPKFFGEDEFGFISRVADLMIPSDGTPGALDVGVPATMDKMVAEVFGAEAQAASREGIGLLMAKMNADGFAEKSDDEALAYLQEMDEMFKNRDTDWAAKSENEQAIRDTYFEVKSSVIGSYFGSEEVATTMLAYEPVPGEYIPCGDLQELTGGKAWAI